MRRRSAVITAVGLFTVIPTPPTEIDRDAGARAMRVFPLVGLLLGAVGALIVAVLAWVSAPALFTAVAVVAAWAALTGGLHLDGIADTADGLGSRKPPEQALAIMRQSDIGPMGVIAAWPCAPPQVWPSTSSPRLRDGPPSAFCWPAHWRCSSPPPSRTASFTDWVG